MTEKEYFLKTEEIIALEFSIKGVKMYTKFDGNIVFTKKGWLKFSREHDFQPNSKWSELLVYDNDDKPIAIIFVDLHKLPMEDFRVDESDNKKEPVKLFFKINGKEFKTLIVPEIYKAINDVRKYGNDEKILN